MIIKNIAVSVVAGIATLASASALAFDFDGIYLLGGVGVGGVNDSKFSGNDDFNSIDPTFEPATEAAADFAWRGGLGFWLTDHFALEANYYGMSDQSSDRNTSFASGTPDLPSTTYDHWTLEAKDLLFFDLTLLGRRYIADDFWVFARGGVAYSDTTRTTYLASTVVPAPRPPPPTIASAADGAIYAHDDNGGLGASIGVGAQYDFTEVFGFRLEASTIQALNNDDFYAVTGNLVVNFGELM